jgi:Tol biopolymer transport system component
MGTAALAALALALCGAAAAHAAYPGENGLIVVSGNSFVRPGEARGLWLVDLTAPDERFRQLTTGDDIWPSWSPDGSEIAFERRSGGSSDIYVVNADGSGLRALTADAASNHHPTWSPDGSQIAYASDTIYVIPAEGGPSRRLDGDDPFFAKNPSWSPDGERIAYSSGQRLPGDHISGPNNSVWTVNLETMTRQRVQRQPFDEEVDWSPDGTQFALSDAPLGSGATLMGVDGTNRRLLGEAIELPNPFAWAPSWSPDGELLTYTLSSSEDGFATSNLVVEEAATGHIWFLLLAPSNGQLGIDMPDWQPVQNRKPVCSDVRVAPRTLWPANRKLRPVRLSGGSDPDGDHVTVEVAWVGQDEPVRGRGDRTAPDAFWTGNPRVALLRAERSARGDGRVYWVDFWVTDEHGARCGGTVEVTVPRHRKRPAIESPFYASSIVLPGESKAQARARRNRLQS